MTAVNLNTLWRQRFKSIIKLIGVCFSYGAMKFFLQAEDIGKNRAEVSLSRISELNSYVNMSVFTEQLTEEFLGKFQVCLSWKARPIYNPIQLLRIWFPYNCMH